MKRNEVFVNQDQMYALTVDDEGNYYLEVVCGGFAMENIIIPLNKDEVKSYKLEGKSFLDQLSINICKENDKFKKRILKL